MASQQVLALLFKVRILTWDHRLDHKLPTFVDHLFRTVA